MMHLLGRVHANTSHTPHLLRTPTASFAIPSRSGFLVADMEDWAACLSAWGESCTTAPSAQARETQPGRIDEAAGTAADVAHTPPAETAPEASFDAVFIDYPWPNASARRSKSYEEVDIYDFYKIRLPDILAPAAATKPVLVAFWLTNHAKYRRFVSQKLMPAWKIENPVNWFWVKVTASAQEDGSDGGGVPVWSLQGSSPRRCYEGRL